MHLLFNFNNPYIKGTDQQPVFLFNYFIVRVNNNLVTKKSGIVFYGTKCRSMYS
jgi:hypothetical protein